MSRPLIVIPARIGSTRFPRKPLADIAGISMIRRTANIASQVEHTDYIVATDSKEIAAHCEAHNIPVTMTRADILSGSDRVLAAAKATGSTSDILVNLQGDAPFTDPTHIAAVIKALADKTVDIATPYIRLGWDDLDVLRDAKKETPFSGTTLIEQKGRAIWFSKNIIPAIRKEADLRSQSAISPICRHIGLYGYRRESLSRYAALPQSPYEKLEGLEQLRALENGMIIAAVEVGKPRISSSGIDTPEDLKRAEALIATYGDPFSTGSS